MDGIANVMMAKVDDEVGKIESWQGATPIHDKAALCCSCHPYWPSWVTFGCEENDTALVHEWIGYRYRCDSCRCYRNSAEGKAHLIAYYSNTSFYL